MSILVSDSYQPNSPVINLDNVETIEKGDNEVIFDLGEDSTGLGRKKIVWKYRNKEQFDEAMNIICNATADRVNNINFTFLPENRQFR